MQAATREDSRQESRCPVGRSQAWDRVARKACLYVGVRPFLALLPMGCFAAKKETIKYFRALFDGKAGR